MKDLPHVAAIAVLFESGLTDLSTAVEIAVYEIGKTSLHNYFAIIGGEVGRQLRGITWYAIHDPLNPKFKDWLQSGNSEIEEGIKRLVECAHRFGMPMDDL